MSLDRNLFCDMDGVLTDWDTHASNVLGRATVSGEPLKKEEWMKLADHPDYFGTMPPLKGAIDFFRDLTATLGRPPIILSMCPGSFSAKAVLQKRRWINKYLGKAVLFIPAIGHPQIKSTKMLYVQQPGDILIDDQRRHIEQWESAGGTGVLFLKSHYSVLHTVQNLIYGEMAE